MPKFLPWLSEKPPAVEARPYCKGGCGRHLRPNIVTVYDKVEKLNSLYYKAQGKKFSGYKGYDGFCTLVCAWRFARAAYAAGYRVKADS